MSYTKCCWLYLQNDMTLSKSCQASKTIFNFQAGRRVLEEKATKLEETLSKLNQRSNVVICYSLLWKKFAKIPFLVTIVSTNQILRLSIHSGEYNRLPRFFLSFKFGEAPAVEKQRETLKLIQQSFWRAI